MDEIMKPDLRIYPDPEALNRAAAEEIAHLARVAVAERGLVTVALSGGRTPRRLYRLLAAEYRDGIPWPQMHLFWGDERYVPPTDPQSNYCLAREALLDRVPIPVECVHPMPTHFPNAEDAARDYEATLRAYFAGSGPTFDLILLGMGAEGHTASLFPGSPALAEHEHWVVAAQAPAQPPLRLSLTLPAINRARNAVFLISGSEKVKAVQSILKNTGQAATRYPAALVHPQERLIWFVDRAALGSETNK